MSRAVKNQAQSDAAPEEAVSPESEKDRAGKGTDRKHGKSFVYLSLDDCDAALRKIDPHHKQMSIEGFARALGHEAPKGRFLNKLDALQSYGLIEHDSENVHLTPLAIDMLYGGSEATKAKMRATAFLKYPDFKKVYVECPKGQDNQRGQVIDFVRAKLGIVNYEERFMKLFLESAHFAGLLDGPLNPNAKVFKLRSAPSAPGASAEPNGPTGSVEDDFATLPIEAVESALEAVGLSAYRDRSDVKQSATGTFKLNVGDGRITVLIDRPIRIVIRPHDLMTELQEILSALNERGLKP
jgi:hypothetical protein